MKVELPLASFSFIVLLALAPAAGRSAPVPAAAAPAAKPAHPYRILESFLGGVWLADLPSRGAGKAPVQIELHFDRAENGQGIRFSSAYVSGTKKAPYTSGIYVWNAAKQKLVIIYTDASGSLTEGPVSVEGAKLTHELTITNEDGTVDTARAVFTKAGDNEFTNDISIKQADSWVKIASVRYVRRAVVLP